VCSRCWNYNRSICKECGAEYPQYRFLRRTK
jgi:hypothetical protein